MEEDRVARVISDITQGERAGCTWTVAYLGGPERMDLEQRLPHVKCIAWRCESTGAVSTLITWAPREEWDSLVETYWNELCEF